MMQPLAAQTTPAAPETRAAIKHKPVTSFGYLDTDKDARISRDEAKADWAVQQRFAEADANKDGYIDAEEFKALTRGKNAARI